jgi:hypothetical protein
MSHRCPWLPALLVCLAIAPTTAYPQDEGAPLASDALFDASVVHRLDLRIHSADWLALKENYRDNTYYPADIVFAGQTVRNTGIRSRGSGSRSREKPGLRVDINCYSGGQTFLGLKSFVLDNLTQDASGVRETVAMAVYRRLGVPAPREAHVRVYVNDQYAGLYAVIESIDKDFLTRVFGYIGGNAQNDGYLFEFDWMDDWRFTYLGRDYQPYKDRFKPQTNETRSDAEKFAPIETLVRLANETYPEHYREALGPLLDFELFVRFVAVQNFVAEYDGFLGYAGVNNFYLYRREGSQQHVFIPWDHDNALKGIDYPIFYHHDENVLMGNAMAVPDLAAHYVETLRDAVRLAEAAVEDVATPWLEHEVTRQLDLIADAMREDPVRPYAYAEHERAREEAIEFARGRPANVAAQLWRHGFGAVNGPRVRTGRTRRDPR